ncbi:subunit of the signal recognition particle [Haematococcus lacustris]
MSEPMDVPSDAPETLSNQISTQAASTPPAQQYNLQLLQLVKVAQGQNGVKHGDYARYRRHCAHKLQALYKALKFQHGRTKYIKRRIEPATITDVRFLHIPIFNAERAWAYSMELKKQVEVEMHARKRRHLVSRLSKAAAWAKDAARLVAAVGDPRSTAEAEAYASWLLGSLLLEKETDWQRALAQLTRARRLFSELARVSTESESQALCMQQVEDMEPTLRYCQYQIERQGGAVPDAQQLLTLSDKAELGSVDELTARLLDAGATSSSAQKPAGLVVLEWQGQQLPARADKVRQAVAQYNELAPELATALQSDASAPAASGEGAGPGSLASRLALFDRSQALLQEALNHTRAALKAPTLSEGDTAYKELAALDSGLRGVMAVRAVDRAALVLSDLEARFATGLQRMALAGMKKGKDKERRDSARPEEVVRGLDSLSRCLAALAELGAAGGGRAGEVLHDRAQAQVSGCQALRCYYLAHGQLAAGRALEAWALFDRAGLRAQEAGGQLGQGEWMQGVQGVTNMGQLEKAAAGYKAVAQAEVAGLAAKEAEALPKGVGGLKLGEKAGAGTGTGAASATPQATFLSEALDQWESFAGGLGAAGAKAPRIHPLPFRMQAIPARPIMLDTALAHLDYPSIEHRLRKAEKKSVLSSLAGWAWGATGRK